MTKKLSLDLLGVAKEYARIFGEIIEAELEFFVGDDPTDMACFGDCFFFSLSEMRDVVDNIDAYQARYGSKEAVGQEIRDWVNWWADADSSNALMERIEPRVTHHLWPNISLKAWLDGCPRQERKPYSGPDAEYMRLQDDADTLKRLIAEYRGSRSLDNVLKNIQAQLDIEEERKAKRDFDAWEKIMKSDVGRQFRKEAEDGKDLY
jgi:hypothetical protein